MNILIVEDEKNLARALQLELEYEGYQVTTTHDGREAWGIISDKTYDLILLDIMLPGLSGMEILRRMRKDGSLTPVILLTARDTTYDKVSGLDLGANDYITKPFEIEELLARIRAQLRQSQNQVSKSKQIKIKDLVIDIGQYQTTWQDEVVELTKREFDLLVYLASNANQVLSRDQLLSEVWGFDYVGETNVVDVYIRYLRQKIDYQLIETVRGIGYVIRTE
ncbi:response regulator transcription factor [Amphibacillus xylanus]|uniref:Two-component system response regulator n=1 Tax=Amphibacillus xylanus (strain ATCC 51415 / DSM 6626 / JCM 7361 / LMG 17667 / NBRC 15112 / Ep01) TaxID=698758 RepID=K0J3S9_AMPXN|nr:two-component system response regulator [Amphibacillus xylanus NBRC 15112]